MADALQSDLVTQIEVVARTLDITPRRPTALASSPWRGPSTGVYEPLEANLVLLRQGDQRLLLATLDLLYPGTAVRRALMQGLGESDPASVVVGASHTHYAPATFEGKPLIGTFDEEYTRAVCDQLTACVESMCAAPGRPAPQWRVGVGELNHSINRRRMTRRGVKMAPNPSGSRDECVTAVVVGDSTGPDLAIWNYACHPVSHPRPGMVAAHFPSVVRRRLREDLGRPNLPVLFFQGFSGETRPSASTRLRRPRDLALFLRWGSGFYDMSEHAYREWAGSMASCVSALLSDATPVEVSAFSAKRVLAPLTDFVTTRGNQHDIAFHRVDLGPALRLIGASAEIVSELGGQIRGMNHHHRHLLLAGCLDDTFGYLPSESMVTVGGYEAGGYCRAFGYEGLLRDAPARAIAAFQRVSQL